MSRRYKLKRLYLTAAQQEAAKQRLYYHDFFMGMRYEIDLIKVAKLGISCKHNYDIIPYPRERTVQVRPPVFYFESRELPYSKVWNWETAITWHFHNIYMKGLCI